MDTRSDLSRLWLAASLGAVSAVALGAALGWWLRGGATQSAWLPPATETKAAAGVTREEIENLKRELLARLDDLSPARAAYSPAASDGQVIELGRRIDALETRVQLLGSDAPRTTRGPAWASARGPGSGSIDSMRERIAAWSKAGEYADQADALVREHQLWTMEDLMQAYGTPARVLDFNDAWTLAYGPFQQEGEELPCMIEFRFREGLVREVDFDCSGRYR